MTPPDPGSQQASRALTRLLVVVGVLFFLLGLSVSDWPDFVDLNSPHRWIADVAKALAMIGLLGLMMWVLAQGRNKPRAIAAACEELLTGAVTGIPAHGITGRASAIPPQISSLPGAQGYGWIESLEVALPEGQARAFIFTPYQKQEEGRDVTVLVHPERHDAAVLTAGGEAWGNLPRPTGFVSDWQRLKLARFIIVVVICLLLGHVGGLLLAWQLQPIA